MKRKLYFLIIGLLFLLVGCHNKDNKIDYLSYQFNYDITIDNFDKFFVLDSKAKILKEGYSIITNLTPVKGFIPKDVAIEIEYKIEYELKPFNKKQMTHKVIIDTSSVETIKNTFTPKFFREKLDNIEIVFFKIKTTKGKVYSNNYLQSELGYVMDEKKNKENYDNFQDFLNTYTIGDSNNNLICYFDVTTSIISRYDQDVSLTVSTILKASSSPFYIELKNDYLHTILIEEKERLTLYTIGEEIYDRLMVDKTVIGNIDDNLVSMGIDEIVSENADVNLNVDYKLVLVEIEDDKYILRGRFIDFIPAENHDKLIETFRELEIDINLLKNSIYEMHVFLDDNELMIKGLLSLEVDNDAIIRINIDTMIRIQLADFDKIDITNPIYYIKAPKTIDQAIDLIDSTKKVQIYENADPHYFYTYLEEGQYLFNRFNSRIKMELLDEDYKKVNLGPLFGQTTNQYNETFFISPGYYYIKINSVNYYEYYYSFQFEKLPYQDYLDNNNHYMLTDGELKFNIEGKYHIITLNYHSEEDGILIVTPKGENIADVYFSIYTNSLLRRENFGRSLYTIKKGDNYLYLVGEVNEYSYQVNFIPQNKYHNLEDTIDILSVDMTDWVVTGREFSESYFKFSAKKGLYKFNFTSYRDNMIPPRMIIYDVVTNSYITSFNIMDPKIVLDEGEYYIEVSNMNQGVFKISCLFVQPT